MESSLILLEIDRCKWWHPDMELTVPTLSFVDSTVRMHTVKKGKFSIPGQSIAFWGKIEMHTKL